MATNILTMNRGDSFSVVIYLNDAESETGYYDLQGDDAVYFGLMYPHQRFEDAIIKKKYIATDTEVVDGTVLIHFDPKDTIDLPAGNYYYMVKLKIDHDEEVEEEVIIHQSAVNTVIDKTKFVIFE